MCYGCSRVRRSQWRLVSETPGAAELASRALRDPQDQRRFVWQVRSALADDIERGEALQPVRLCERTKESKDRRPLSREYTPRTGAFDPSETVIVLHRSR